MMVAMQVLVVKVIGKEAPLPLSEKDKQCQHEKNFSFTMKPSLIEEW